jgi:uncharacterized protein YidB (DUF937 family)
MSLFSDLAGQALSGALSGSGGSQSGLMGAALQMLNNQPGGIAGLAESFAKNGLGDAMQSWIGNGANAPVSAGQVESVLGSDALSSFAEKAGISKEAAGRHLAELLPVLIDKLTPNGQAPAGGTDLLSLGMRLFGGK